MSSKSYIRALKNTGPRPDRSPPDNSKRTAPLQHPPTPRPTMHDVGTQTSPHLYPSSSMDPTRPGPEKTPDKLKVGGGGMKWTDKWPNAIFCPDPSIAFAGTWDEVIHRPPPPRLPSIEGVQEESPAEWMGWKEKAKDMVDGKKVDAVSPVSSGAVGSAGSPVSPLSPVAQTDTGNKSSPASQSIDPPRFSDGKNALLESRYPPDEKSIPAGNDDNQGSPTTRPRSEHSSNDNPAKRDPRESTHNPSPPPIINDGMGCKDDPPQHFRQEKPSKDHGIAVFDDYLESGSPAIFPDWRHTIYMCPTLGLGSLQLGSPPFVDDEPVICMTLTTDHNRPKDCTTRTIFDKEDDRGRAAHVRPVDAADRIRAQQHGREVSRQKEEDERKKAEEAEEANEPRGRRLPAATIQLLSSLPGFNLDQLTSDKPFARRNAMSGASSAESSKATQSTELEEAEKDHVDDQHQHDRNHFFKTPDYNGDPGQGSGPNEVSPQLSPRSRLPPASSEVDSPSEKAPTCMMVRFIEHSSPDFPDLAPLDPVMWFLSKNDRSSHRALKSMWADAGNPTGVHGDMERQMLTTANYFKLCKWIAEQKAQNEERRWEEAEAYLEAFKRLQRQMETELLMCYHEGYDYLSSISLDVFTYEIGAADEMPSVQEARVVSVHRVRPQQVHSVITHRNQPPKGTRRLQKRGCHFRR